MKKDAIESLAEIRKLCEEVIANPTGHYGESPGLLFARIEWICRHALEDYEIPMKSNDIDITRR